MPALGSSLVRTPTRGAPKSGYRPDSEGTSSMSFPDHEAFHSEEDGDPEFASMNSIQLILLTIGAIGLQMAWGIETSYGSPFLQSLGISKSTLSFVWIAGPLSGVIIQPVIGVFSDNFQSRWGRRRPFIIGAAVTTVVLLMALSWCAETVRYIASFLVDIRTELPTIKALTAIYAIVLVYILDFSINALQACLRVFLVDGAPKHQQDSANAWLSRISGLGHIICFYFGRVNLPEFFNSTSWSQFQLLCLVGSFLILGSTGLSVVTTKELYSQLQQRQASQPSRYRELGTIAKACAICADTFFQIVRAARNLPPTVLAVCRIQFVAWLGWFPFLFYATTYVGHLYVDPILEANPNATPEEVEDAWLQGTRIGSAALLAYSFISFFASMALPVLVKPLSDSPVTPRRPESGLGLTWMTLFATTSFSGGTLIALMGIPWAVTAWAPFAFVGADTARRKRIHEEATGNLVSSNERTDATTALLRPDALQFDATSPASVVESQTSHYVDAGLIFGIHNMFISSPQILSSLACSLIFAIFQKPRNVPGDDSVGWTLRLAGLTALAAAYLTRKLSNELV